MTYSIFEIIRRRLGILSKSLQYLADKDLREWRKENEEYKKYKLRWWEVYFLQPERRPFQSSLYILFLALFFTATTFFLDIYAGMDISSVFSTTLLTHGSANQGSNAEILLTYFTGLWGVQAAIIGLVYPIAISFVTILLQREYRSDAYLRIYLTLSAARSSGSRSLALVIIMGAQYLILLNAGITLPFVWLVLDGLIFLENGAGAFWFLAQTFQFLSHTAQSEAVRRYAVSIAWPRELHERMLNAIFASAPSLKLLPAKDYGDTEAEREPQVLCLPLGKEEGVTELKKRFSQKKRFVDVRFRLLAHTVARWRDRAIVKAQTQEDDSWHRWDNPLLTFPLIVWAEYEKDVMICISRNAPKLNAWDRFVMKHAFVFRRPSPPELGADLTTSEIFDQYTDELRFAIQDDRMSSFEKACDAMIELVVALVKAGDYKLDSGKWDNYTKLSDAWSFGFSNFYQKWLMLFRDPIKLAANSSLTRNDFAIYIANIPYQLASGLDVHRHREIISYSFRLWESLCYFVVERWTTAVEEQGDIDHDYTTPRHLRAPFQRSYQTLTDGLLERWESLGKYNLQPRGENADWQELQVVGEGLLPNHIDTLCHAFLLFTHAGDRTGAERMLDGILHWPDYRSAQEIQSNFFSVVNHQTLGLEMFTQEWTTLEQNFIRDDDAFERPVMPYTIFTMSLSHYWQDVCLITFGALLRWCGSEGGPHPFPADLARRLATGESPHPDDHMFRSPPFGDAEEVLWGMFRQRMAHTTDPDSFGGRFSGMIEKIFSLDKPQKLANRVYTLVGLNGVRSFTKELLLALLLKAENRRENVPWSPSPDLLSAISNIVTTGQWDGADLITLLDEWIGELQNEEFDRHRETFLCLVETDDESIFDNRKNAAINGLQILRERISGTRNQRIVEASIDDALLVEIGLWASRSGFNATGPLPLSFFMAVEQTENLLSDRTLRITKVNKARYTSPRFEDPPINEKGWFASTVADHVAASLLSSIFDRTSFKEIATPSPETFWKQVKMFSEGAKEANNTPALLVPWRNDPEWLSGWLRRYPSPGETIRPDDMRVWWKESMPKEYIANLDEVEVYRAPIPGGASFLMIKEAFERVRFHRYEESRFVDIVAEEVEGKPLLINLRLTWQTEVDIKQLPAVKLRHPAK